MTRITLSREHVEAAFADLADGARAANNRGAAAICSTVANVIAATKSTDQVNLMDVASRVGFTAEFYPGGIRVHWHQPAPAEGPKWHLFLVGDGEKSMLLSGLSESESKAYDLVTACALDEHDMDRTSTGAQFIGIVDRDVCAVTSP